MPIGLYADIMIRIEEPLEVITKSTRIPDTGDIVAYTNTRERIKATEGGQATADFFDPPDEVSSPTGAVPPPPPGPPPPDLHELDDSMAVWYHSSPA